MDSEMTRSRIKRMEYESTLPIEMDGKLKQYEEVFINSGGEKSSEKAQKHLEDIQKQHPESSGWYCPCGHEGVFKDEKDGLWYAYRHHAQYI